MVNPSKVISSLLAFGLIDRCRGEYDQGTQTVTYFPIVEDWAGEGSSLTVTVDSINANYKRDSHAHGNCDQLGSLYHRRGHLNPKIYDFIAGVIESKSDVNSCCLNFGADTEGTYFGGYAYKATTSGSNCHAQTGQKTILVAVKKCAYRLHEHGATRGCCAFTLGGTWTGHLRLSAEPTEYPATSVTC
ncbi:uncharacterized protein N7458_007566 [Penicillium daleae]|uniref:Secreted protein CSS2 C-terminal domain-containing protein n=1 Tax=Penicillium daleae TaxID=63821 RepID=A0AAD6G0E9_9EURO|nr:uncharacterized protein N7458_007566 [Penicillium daleae]KAJ5443694.1 hypothetical protein N7458_007566 [Penicillium daleae]